MKKILIPIMLCACSYTLANEPVKECKPPIKQQALTYQKTSNTPIYFAGFTIEPPKPEEIAFFNEDLLLKYPNKKTISFSFTTNILINGREAGYDPVAVYKEAFGIHPRQAKNNGEIKAIIRLQRLCDNELISYKINNIDYDVIRTKYHNSFSDQQTINTFVLGEPQEVYMINFKGFTTSEIDQILSTIYKPNKK